MSMTVLKTVSFALATLFSASTWPAQDKPQSRLILRVDETASGPNEGQESSGCLRVYSDGKVIFARWWNSAVTIVDSATKRASRPEYTVSVEHHLVDADLRELSTFLESKAVRKLPEEFGPPHPAIDFFESVSVEIFGSKGNIKKISTREYNVANLEEKSRYPAALILLLERIKQIEEAASNKGKPTEVPVDCPLKQKEH
jgi:hypothetical protein